MTTIAEAYEVVHQKMEEASKTGDHQALKDQIPPLQEMTNQDPMFIPAQFGLATCYMLLGCQGQAIPVFDWINSVTGGKSPEGWNNLGTSWKALNFDENAKACWEQAYALKPHPDYMNNIGTLYINVGAPEKGIYPILKGLSMDYQDPRLHWNYGLLNLEMGNWRQGFKHHEFGLATKDRPDRVYPQNPEAPFWDGENRVPGCYPLGDPEDLGKARVLVYGEQGMGDEIMFMSALEDLHDEGVEIILDCHDRMEGLFRRSFPWLRAVHPTRKQFQMDQLKWDTQFDYKLACGTLFKHFRSNGEFPKKPYLKADPELVEHYREKLKETGDGPYVGISWSAGYRSTRNDLRSLKLGWFMPLIEKGGTFISLQYRDENGKCERFNEENDFKVHHWPDVVETGPQEERYTGFDYDHTIALIEALDLLVVPNTTVVHAAGALGTTPCWTLTPDGPAWRYQLHGDRMPTYGDNVLQIRQEGRPWPEVLEKVGQDYAESFVDGR